MFQISRARKLGKYFLLVDNLLVVLGFCMVFPLIAVHFTNTLGWKAIYIGIALGLRQFLQQGLGVLGGAIADRVGVKPTIVTGMLLRAIGFATLAIANEPWILWLSCSISALGGMLFEPPRTALVIKFTRPAERGRFYSILMIQDSAGAVTGALIGSILLQYDFHYICWIGASIFILAAFWNIWILPPYHLSRTYIPIGKGLLKVMEDRNFLLYALTLTGYYILAVQVMLMFPIVVSKLAGTPQAVKWMYVIEAILSIFLLYPIARWSEKRFTLEQRLMTGLLLMSFSIFFIGFIHSINILFIFICCFYLGTITAEPARETLCASLANSRARGSYSGFSRLGLAFGGALGYTGGGWLYDAGYQLNVPGLPWFLLGFIGLCTFILLYWQFYSRRAILKKKLI